jgi:hypothetical protein
MHLLEITCIEQYRTCILLKGQPYGIHVALLFKACQMKSFLMCADGCEF